MNNRYSRLIGLVVPVLLLLAALLASRFAHLVGLPYGSGGRTIVIAVSVLGSFACLVTYYEYHGFGKQEGIVRRGSKQPVVAITFDDGPSPMYTPKILDILNQKNVRASFFCVGLHVEKYPEIARRIIREGHDIGNHTYTHKDLVATTRSAVKRQLGKTDEAIYNVTGVVTRLFRPPRGLYSEAARRIIVDELGYQMILWTVSALDWRRDMRPRQIVKRIARYVHPGAIILFHDSGALLRREGGKRSSTVKALPMVIDYLRDAGYEIVPISEMLERLVDEQPELRRILERA